MVALPLASINQVVASYVGLPSILALLVVIGSAVITRFLVTLTFRSLGQVESTADAIAAGDFGLRMTDIEPTTTEVGRLKTAINAMLDRVDAAISQRDATVRQMRRFIGDASHELRTPLVTVRGYAELYRMGAIRGDEDVTQSMDRIEKEAIRMAALVEDLLALARLDERRDVVITAVDLRPVARDAALDVRAASPLRSVTVIDTTSRIPSRPLRFPQPSPAGSAAPRRAPRPSRAPVERRCRCCGARPRPVPAVTRRAAARRLHPPSTSTAVKSRLRPFAPVCRRREPHPSSRREPARQRPPLHGRGWPIDLRVGVDRGARMGWIEVVDHGEEIPDQIKEKIFQRFWRAAPPARGRPAAPGSACRSSPRSSKRCTAASRLRHPGWRCDLPRRVPAHRGARAAETSMSRRSRWGSAARRRDKG